MILYLQQFIYQKLNQPNISNQVNGIYYQVPANTKFPYIYFGNFVSKDISAKDIAFHDIRFKLTLYLREKSLKSMLLLTRIITQILSCNGKDKIISMRCLEQKINLQNDGVTHEIILSFKALVEE